MTMRGERQLDFPMVSNCTAPHPGVKERDLLPKTRKAASIQAHMNVTMVNDYVRMRPAPGGWHGCCYIRNTLPMFVEAGDPGR